MTESTLEIPAPLDRNYGNLRYHASGSEAEVYTATYVPTGQRVALKVLIPRGGAVAARERREKRFLKEASLLRDGGGPHVVRVYEVLDVRLRGEPTKAFSMEWLPETFAALASRHQEGLPLNDLTRYRAMRWKGCRCFMPRGWRRGICVRRISCSTSGAT